jgi:hypothetical protein
LQGIDAWVKQIAASDIDYKAKEAKVIDQVDEVIKNYPPEQWLPTLKLLYSGDHDHEGSAAKEEERQPLRPTGAKPGQKAPARWARPSTRASATRKRSRAESRARLRQAECGFATVD